MTTNKKKLCDSGDRDTLRLDWLETQTHHGRPNPQGNCVHQVKDIWTKESNLNLREAIDKAMGVPSLEPVAEKKDAPHDSGRSACGTPWREVE